MKWSLGGSLLYMVKILGENVLVTFQMSKFWNKMECSL